MQLDSYGKSTGFCVDPIEKKPLAHFLPGTSVLSFGTAGCNLGCKFCQNWSISKSREIAALSEQAAPDDIAHAAAKHGCRSVAFTYNDPVIFAEYAIDTAVAARALDVRAVAVTAGYITPVARRAFFEPLDAVNVDLKAFTERFYRELCFAALEPVLDTLRWLTRRDDGPRPWLEITTLVIPGHNDDQDELRRLASFVCSELGPHVPLHLSAFHPDFNMRDVPRTPLETLARARELAKAEGLHHVYTGNVQFEAGDTTFCSGCGDALIVRERYALKRWNLVDGACASCGTALAGVFEARAGDVSLRSGRRRFPVRV